MKPLVDCCALPSALAAPAYAQDPLAPLPSRGRNAAAVAQQPDRRSPPPPPVAAPIVVPRDWPGVFAAIRGGNWASARIGIDTLPRGPLTAVARAELFTANKSPVVALPEIQMLLAEAPELPQAEQLARMAVARGAAHAAADRARRPVDQPRRRARPIPRPPGCGRAARRRRLRKKLRAVRRRQ